MVALNAPALGAVPPPERVRAELLTLYQQLRLTRALLKLSERIHTNDTSTAVQPARQESAHARG